MQVRRPARSDAAGTPSDRPWRAVAYASGGRTAVDATRVSARAAPAQLNVPLPTKVDWRNSSGVNLVSPVRDQGACGACWAFSTVEVIESAWAKAKRQLVSLSEQQVMSCVKNPSCAGRELREPLSYFKSVRGLESADAYPYDSGQGSVTPCKYDESRVLVPSANFSFNELVGNEQVLQQIVALASTLAVTVNPANWQDYIGASSAGS